MVLACGNGRVCVCFGSSASSSANRLTPRAAHKERAGDIPKATPTAKGFSKKPKDPCLFRAGVYVRDHVFER